MARIHIVTDSGSDLPKEVCERFGISVVPLSIQFGDDIYRDGVDMQVDEFYQRLRTGDTLPSTCQPSPADFVKVYESIAQAGDTIISVHLSSKLSGTYQSSVLAASMLPDLDVVSVDTQSASMGIGLTAIAAAEAVKAGKSKEEVIAVTERIVEQLGVYFMVDTLEFLKKNGRIGRASALMGTLLNIKPILTLQDGIVTPFEKARGKAKALKRITEAIAQYSEQYPGQALRLGVTHSDALADAERIAAEFKEQFPVHDIFIASIGPTIGVHVGPGTLAVLFYPVPA